MIVHVVNSNNEFWFKTNDHGFLSLPRVGEVITFEGKGGLVQGINHHYYAGKNDTADSLRKPNGVTIKVTMLPDKEEK